MNGNTQLLNYVYQNSQIGLQTIGQLTKIADDTNFMRHLNTQFCAYKNINSEAEKLLVTSGEVETRRPAMAKMATQLSINAKTFSDNSPGHLAEIMMQGSTMGIIDVTKNINKYRQAEPQSLALAEKLLHTEESNMEQLKSFL